MDKNDNQNSSEIYLTYNADYYLKRKSKIIKKNWALFELYFQELSSKLDDNEICQLEKEFREEIDMIIPQIPYIGGSKNIFSAILEKSALFFSFWKTLVKKGWSIEDFLPIHYSTLKRFVDTNYSGIKGKLGSWVTRYILTGAKIEKSILRKNQEMVKHPEKKYFGDFIMEFVPGDQKNFEYGYNMKRCTIYEFAKAEGVAEIMPYFCVFDYFRGKYTKSGLIRSKTLPEGDEMCDYRLNPGKCPQNRQKTQIPSEYL